MARDVFKKWTQFDTVSALRQALFTPASARVEYQCHSEFSKSLTWLAEVYSLVNAVFSLFTQFLTIFNPLVSKFWQNRRLSTHMRLQFRHVVTGLKTLSSSVHVSRVYVWAVSEYGTGRRIIVFLYSTFFIKLRLRQIKKQSIMSIYMFTNNYIYTYIR